MSERIFLALCGHVLSKRERKPAFWFQRWLELQLREALSRRA